ncbi:zinc fingers and homeoboxes protein 1-like isoform X2 [Syngnathoides biaculeatus]|uniref:zinc fingers and homeoboxes protein 1-like isoform X2 n=1 Tax=Syngnathoides biaculeatus TaxID=300417 RepID=UPI002ADD6C44|nr:zinc fingers and homeoboxes protein 1-like isoform X2 [Syngnathoides biaculeatus]
MASRRKSSTPRMRPPRAAPRSDGEAADPSEDGVSRPLSAEGGYECKYCDFRTKTLNLMTAHSASDHPDVSYVCAECDYRAGSNDSLAEHDARRHPGRDKGTRAQGRPGGQTVRRQIPDDGEEAYRTWRKDTAACQMEDGDGEAQCKGIALSKTPIMRSRTEPKKFTALHKAAAEDVIKVESEDEMDEYEDPPALSPAPPPPVPASAPLQIQAGPNVLHIKGALPAAALPAAALAQVLSAMQKQNQNQLLIPVSSIPAYNPAMDNNVLLLGAYNRFPYPSPSEIAALASQTKFSEENVKVWFSAQRLKHGVSWTPEEVEEARRKRSNGTVQTLHQSLPQAITVIPTNGLQSIFQTCQIVGQPGLVLAQVGGGAAVANVPVAAPVALSVAGVPGNLPKAAEANADSRAEKASSDSASKPKKSKEQLAELKASYGRRQFATDSEISRLMQVTGLSKRAIKKWFSDTRYNQRNSRDLHHDSQAGGSDSKNDGDDNSASSAAAAIVIESSDDADFTPQKFKEKTSGQLAILESSFCKCDTPSDDELTRLRAQTKLTRREVNAWFGDRRKGMAPASPASPPFAGRRVLKKTPAQLDILKKAFLRSRWPTAEEYDKMAEDCGLPRNYVVNWFGDTRYAAKNSNLKWFGPHPGGKVDQHSLDGPTRTPKKSRKRFRGWSRRTRRAYAARQDTRALGEVCKDAKSFNATCGRERGAFLRALLPAASRERGPPGRLGVRVGRGRALRRGALWRPPTGRGRGGDWRRRRGGKRQPRPPRGRRPRNDPASVSRCESVGVSNVSKRSVPLLVFQSKMRRRVWRTFHSFWGERRFYCGRNVFFFFIGLSFLPSLPFFFFFFFFWDKHPKRFPEPILRDPSRPFPTLSPRRERKVHQLPWKVRRCLDLIFRLL